MDGLKDMFVFPAGNPALLARGATMLDGAALAGVGPVAVPGQLPNGLIDRKASGPSPKLNDAQRRALVRIVESGPIPAIHGVVRWRLKDLAKWIWEEFRITLDETTLGREVTGPYSLFEPKTPLTDGGRILY